MKQARRTHKLTLSSDTIRTLTIAAAAGVRGGLGEDLSNPSAGRQNICTAAPSQIPTCDQ